MDWSKAKNVLIVAFIITNLLLVYVIQKDSINNERFQLANDDYIQNVESFLSDNGIKLDVEIQNKSITLPMLMVRYKTFDIKEIAKTFLGEDYNIINDNIYQSGKKRIERISNKKFVYTDSSNVLSNYPLSEEEVTEISKDFLKKHNLMSEDLKLQQIYLGAVDENSGVPLYKLVYNQVYKNQFLAESYINVYIRHDLVVGLEVMLLEYEKTQGGSQRVIPATEAILRKMNDILSDNEDGEDIVISSLELGYYFNTNDIDLTTWETIASGTAFPSWKIVLSNGKTYYTEALRN